MNKPLILVEDNSGNQRYFRAFTNIGFTAQMVDNGERASKMLCGSKTRFCVSDSWSNYHHRQYYSALSPLFIVSPKQTEQIYKND